MITIDQASEMGAKGAEPTETERLLFEAWMRGHCWLVQGDWDGKSYVHESENTGYLHPGAMLTRQLWAAWRDRAALAEQPAQQKPVNQRAHEMALRQWDHWKQYALELQEKLVKYEGGAQMILNTSPQPAQPQEPVAWCPDVCPITGLPFFMWIEHYETGQRVPTYGGPYDSYTIPVRVEDGSYCRERYDHDYGGWLTDEVEDVGIQIVSDQVYVSENEPPAQRKPLTPEKVVKLKDAFYAGFESYVTPAAPCSDVDEEWAKYKSAHNIKENT